MWRTVRWWQAPLTSVSAFIRKELPEVWPCHAPHTAAGGSAAAAHINGANGLTPDHVAFEYLRDMRAHCALSTNIIDAVM
jgi:hypothetical protein